MPELIEASGFEVEEWEVGGGRVLHGVRCTAHRKSDGQRCTGIAVEGYHVCKVHGAGTHKRVAEGTAKSPATAALTTGLFSTRLAKNLRVDIEELSKRVNAAESAKRSLATVEILLDVITKKVQDDDEGFGSERNLNGLLTLANELQKAARVLSDVQGRTALTIDDLVFISKSFSGLLISLAEYVPEGQQRDQFLQAAREGLVRVLGTPA